MQRLVGFLIAMALASMARAGDLKGDLGEVDRRLKAGDRTQALDLLTNLVAQYPDSLEAHALYQDVLKSAGRQEELLAAYAKRVKEDPKNVNARYLYARLLTGSRAVSEFRELTRTAPDFAPGWVGLARTLDAARQEAEAEQAVRKGIQLDPLSPAAAELLGWILEHRGNRKEAEAAYRRAIELDATWLPARWNLAHLLARDRRGKEALEQMQEAQRIAPGDPQVLVHRAMVFGSIGRNREAAQCYEAALKKAPNDTLALVLLAETYAELSEWNLAGQAVSRALALDEKLPAAHAVRGYAALRQGLAAEAAAAYTLALKYDPDRASYAYYLALSQDKAGLLKEAISNYKKATQLGKENPFYWLAYGGALEARDRPMEAAAAYAEATALAPDDAYGWIRLGHASAEARRPKDAIAAFQKALAIDPKKYVEVWKSMGIVYEVDLKDEDRAAECYRRYISNGGSDKRVRSWLDDLTK